MIKISKISKNLIGVSIISSMMVFWLGSRYLSDAHSQFTSALHLQSSVAPERTLFEIAHNLDQQRGTVQRVLIGSTDFDEKHDQLDTLASDTRTLFAQIQQEIAQSRSHVSGSTSHQKRNQSIEKIIGDLEDRLKRIAISNAIITGQIFLPHERRDERVRMQMYDVYSNLIVSTDNLRKRTHALPEKDFEDVLIAHDIKNSIWFLSDSINQSSTLLETLLLKLKFSAEESLNVDNLALRIFQQHDRINLTLSELAEIVKGNAIYGVSSEAVADLTSYYEKNFRSLVNQVMLANPETIDIDDALTRWLAVSGATKEKVRLLQDAALANTLSTAESIKYSATQSLIANTLLVFLCIAMAYATFVTSKTIQYQADHDDLTNMPNRRYFNATLGDLFKKTDITRGEKIVLMTLDLNGFKAINDTMGHVAGDNLLIEVSSRLSSMHSTRSPSMLIARMGGDEFAIAQVFNNSDEPHQLATTIRDKFKPVFELDGSQVKIDTSIGYSIYPDDAKTLNDLQITSDFAMFSAKQQGRKTIQPYVLDIAKRFENRIAIEKDLVCAIENNELELHYQPQINLDTDKVTSVEALVRWNHPSRGVVPPVEFIGIAEETGLMANIGSWVMNEACRQLAEWNETACFSINMAVNVSVHQLMSTEFVHDVCNAIETNNISASSLELEITETVVMTDIDLIVESLQALKSIGVRIALDDFGTGYSSLSQLHKLPLDTLKIDRAFISTLDVDSQSTRSVTATIASIADIYALETVAEGIESGDQLNEVRKLGINVAQGYYYSKPLSKDKIVDAIASINQWGDRLDKVS